MLRRFWIEFGLGPRFEIFKPGVLVFVAVDAQQLPVRAVRGIVVMIAVPVVHGELAQALSFELAAAARADVRQQPERGLPVRGVRMFRHAETIPRGRAACS